MKSKYLKYLLYPAITGVLAITAGATTITLKVGLGTDTAPYEIGEVVAGIQSGGHVNRDVTMVNNLISLFPSGGTSTTGSSTYTTSGNYTYSSLPAASSGGAVYGDTPDGFSGFSGDSVVLTLPRAFQYFVAAWDGPNGGVAVYDISTVLAGDILDVPRYAHPTTAGKPGVGPLVAGDKFQMTGFTFLNPTDGGGTPPPVQYRVPDGGTTVALLGLSLLGFGGVRRMSRARKG